MEKDLVFDPIRDRDLLLTIDWQGKDDRKPLKITAFEELSSWLSDAENNVNIQYFPQDGFVKIAFTHAFRHLLLGSDYEEAIWETLLGGGDTDTNACIVGGLIGAACGIHAIPESMTRPVLRCNTRLGENIRPGFLSAIHVFSIGENLLKLE